MRIVVMTGGTAGFGAFAAKRISSTPNTNLFLGARDTKNSVETLPLDLARLSSVRSFVRSLTKKLDGKKIDSLILNAGGTLEGLPPNERVAMEAVLLYNPWEDSRGMPRRLFMSAEKQKLRDAKAAHAGQPELAAIIEEQER